MNLFRKPKVLTLPYWLEVATRKLNEASKERIRAEIEAHYAEAVAAHRENGVTDADANTAALAELGDARVAGKRFRKEHLTEREAGWLEKTYAEVRKPSGLILPYIVFCFFATFSRIFPGGQPHPWRCVTLLFLACVVAPTVGFVFARRAGAKSNRSLIVIRSLSYFLVWPWLYEMYASIGDLKSHPAAFLFMLLGTQWRVLYELLIGFKVWRKLGKSGVIADYTPPRDAAQA